MMNNIKQIKEYVKGNEIYEKVTVKEHKNEHYARLNGSVFMPKVWDELVAELGRIPSQKEFTIRGVIHSKKWFTDENKMKDGKRWRKLRGRNGQQYWHGFEWNESLMKSVAHRVWRSYPSMVAEHTTLITMRELYPTATFLVSDDLDYIIGSDITMILDDKVYYVHVLRDTYGSFNMMKQKGTYTTGWYGSDKQRYSFKRDFNHAHLTIAYDNKNTWKTEEYNGLVFMDEDYIVERVEKAIGEDFLDSQVYKLHLDMRKTGHNGIDGIEEYLGKEDWSWLM